MNFINVKIIVILKIFIISLILLVFVEIILANFIKQRLYKFDPTLGWDLKKNLKGVKRDSGGKKYEIFTNKFNMRSDGKKILYNPCDFDFVILGDSITFGEGIDIENRFDLLINKELKSINFGVQGFSILQSYLKQKKHINQFNCEKPKKLIIVIYENDINDALSPHTAYRYRPLLLNKKIHFPNNLYNSIHGTMRDLSYAYFLSNLVFIVFKFDKKKDYNIDNILPLLNEIQYVQEDTIHNEIYIFLHGFKKKIGNKILNNAVCEKANCFDTFISYRNNPQLYIQNDSHWNEKGHKAFSNFLIDNLKVK